ncbi:MAG: ATP-dependent helicase [Planctomycetia bacterium]|nr:ATP-dependent helicase [Planctomycetia bacterium]
MPTIDEVLRTELTDPQRAAATDPAQEVLCLACAGSGKSRTLAYRTARLIAQGADPKSIVAFTFTEKAADSIKLRIAQALSKLELDPAVLGALYVGTIHSYCQYILGEMDARYRQFDVLDDNRLHLYLLSRYWPGDRNLNLPAVQASRGGQRPPGQFETITRVANAWKTLNDELLNIADVSANDRPLGEALQRLSDRLAQDQFLDFSLMIRLVVDALRRGDTNARRAVSDLKHLMVDEYQDINPAQEALIRELHALSETLFVVGDDDQSIYAWRGADVRNILTFQDRYPACSTQTLSRNFRSTEAIVGTSDRFVAAELGPTRFAKNPQAVNPVGPRDFRILWYNARQDEADWVADRIAALMGTAYREGTDERGLTPADFAILMRSTRTAEQTGEPRHDAFTAALRARNIDYSLEAGGGVFDRQQVRVLRDTFELLRGGSPTRETTQTLFNNEIQPAFPRADFNRITAVLADWGRRIHEPVGGPRRKVYPQQLLHDLLSAFGLGDTQFPDGVMQDLGIFSRILQDVETVYLSIDTAGRFRELLNFMQQLAESGYDTGTDDVVRRPDAVTVSTVHKIKGLEFPVVFVVDVEAQRFPGNQRRYDGWLPLQVIQPALDRGAYRSTPAEEARLFYTALTRAERYLYVTGSANLPGGTRPRQPSRFSQRLVHAEIERTDGLPQGLVPCPPAPRIDETIVPTSFSDIRYYLRCPQDYRLRKSFGFSPPIIDMFGFGQTVHAAVCKLHELFPTTPPTREQASDVARSVFHLKHVPPSNNPDTNPGPYERARDASASIVQNYADSYAADFTQRRQVEVRFEIPARQLVISGSIDLLLREDAAGNIVDATVVDFKAMEGGEAPAESERLDWTELSLQVQLYAKAAREVLGQNARTGAVHLLKDNRRQVVPVDDAAVDAAVRNVEWAIERILAGDFPARPHRQKCEDCDFKALCGKRFQEFATDAMPPAIRVPGQALAILPRAFSQLDQTMR